jgi:uncharacterized membrane protein YkvA (DUF1232 family)
MDIGVIVGVALGLVVAWALFVALLWVLRPKGVAAREVVGIVPDLLRLVRDVVRDPTAPADVRIVLVGALVWLGSPIDLIPEFIPLLGPLDDVIVVVAVLRYVRRRIGVHAIRARWSGTDDGFELLGRVMGFAQP